MVGRETWSSLRQGRQIHPAPDEIAVEVLRLGSWLE